MPAIIQWMDVLAMRHTGRRQTSARVAMRLARPLMAGVRQHVKTFEQDSSDVHIFMPLRCGHIGNAAKVSKTDSMQLLDMQTLRSALGVLSKKIHTRSRKTERSKGVYLGRQAIRVFSLFEMRVCHSL